MAALEVLALDTATPQIRAPGTGDTYTAPRALALTAEALTGAQATSALEIAQTWNTTGIPAALLVSVTNTASGTLSSVANFLVGGLSALRVDKSLGVSMGNAKGGFLYSTATNHAFFVSSAGYYSFSSATSPNINNSGEMDTRLYRDAVGVVAQRNGTAAQTLRVYTTYTDASNHSRLAITGTAITLETAGTGVDNIDLSLVPAGTGNVVLPGGVLLKTSAALTDGAGASAGTLANAPSVGNPTKWIPINDNGTTRYIPAW